MDMKTANYLRPMNGYVIARLVRKRVDIRQYSDLFRVVGISKDETEIKVDDLIEAFSKDYYQIDTPIFTDAFRLNKSDVIGIYCLMPDAQQMFEPFDSEEE
jgi:hypothetical protein